LAIGYSEANQPTEVPVRVLAQAEFQFPDDGRQSETARAVARGTRRLLRAHGYATVTELPLADGRRADIVALGQDGTISIVEVKSSLADYRADTKWRFYRAHCDRLLFAIPPAMPIAVMPDDAGLIVADAYGAEIVRPAVEKKLSAATRRAMFIRFGQAAAHRLHRLGDPDGWADQQGLL
jgi:hypothetical protein